MAVCDSQFSPTISTNHYIGFKTVIWSFQLVILLDTSSSVPEVDSLIAVSCLRTTVWLCFLNNGNLSNSGCTCSHSWYKPSNHGDAQVLHLYVWHHGNALSVWCMLSDSTKLGQDLEHQTKQGRIFISQTIGSLTAPELDSLKSSTKRISDPPVHCYQVPTMMNEWWCQKS